MTEESLFELAVNTPENERAALLDRECAGNPDLRARLEALLAADARPADWLAKGEHTAAYQSPIESAGTVIAGKYKLLQQIGEGGMGSVWMADQTEPVKRRVAVKLIRVERGGSKTILARFEAERQAIALMDHPNIARLLDAGTTGDPGALATGVPFFVMDLVKGVPLTEYCDTHKLSMSDRLNLFMQICSAVQHAHQKGIIHRDLKPTNILVESHDGKPVPKVIDFGLAKATSGLQLTENTLFTGFGSVMGTPLYMAPEQANFNAVDVDTRADIYALGVILYELLTGTTPIARETIKKAALDEIVKLVREQEAPSPSSRISNSEAQPSVAANRQMESAKLGRFVKGELDWIVLKALAKERDRRYETANGFARDIERFLGHEPVQAGPPSASYRFKKFVQRNRGRVIAASLVMLTLLLGAVGTAFGLVLAIDARDEEANQRLQAETQSRRATKAEQDANDRAGEAAREKKKAEDERDRTKFQLSRAESARHAIQIDQALRVAERFDFLEARRYLTAAEPLFLGTWEQRHLLDFCQRRTTSLHGHTGRILQIVMSSDGQRVVSASGGEPKPYALAGQFKLGQPPTAEIREVRVWDATQRKESFNLPIIPLEIHNVALSGNGQLIATGHSDGSVALWNAATGEKRKQFTKHSQWVAAVAVSEDGQRVVSSSVAGDVKIWDASTGKDLANIVAKGQGNWEDSLFKMAYSTNGRRLVTVRKVVPTKEQGLKKGLQLAYDLKVWEAETGKEERTIKVSGSVVRVAISADASHIVANISPVSNNVVRVWDAVTGEEKLSFRPDTPVAGGAALDVAISGDGKRVALATLKDEYVTVRDVTGRQDQWQLSGNKDAFLCVAISADGQRVVSGGEGKRVSVWNLAEGQAKFTLVGGNREMIREFLSVAFSHDGRRIVAGSNTGIRPDLQGPGRGAVKVWDAGTNQPLFSLSHKERGSAFTEEMPFHGYPVTAVAFSPDGQRIATGSGGILESGTEVKPQPGEVRIWAADSGTELAKCKGHPQPVRGVAFSPDGQHFVSASDDQTLIVWDVNSGEALATLRGHTEAVTSVAYSKDGLFLVSGSADKSVKIWDAKTWRDLRTLRGHTGEVTTVAMSGDGQRIVSGSKDLTLKVWDTASGEEKFTLQGHAFAVNCVAFSPNGDRIVSGSGGSIKGSFATLLKPGELKLWDAATGQEKLTLKGHSAGIFSVAFSPDGRRIASAGGDWTVKVWDAPPSGE